MKVSSNWKGSVLQFECSIAMEHGATNKGTETRRQTAVGSWMKLVVRKFQYFRYRHWAHLEAELDMAK
jgi:hypothetical protein